MGMTAPSLVVSIINFRTAQMTMDCVASVLADSGTTNIKIVVIDNNSGDGSGDKIAKWMADHPRKSDLRFIQSATNSGFSGGHNQIFAAEPDADYYLVLNSDAVLKAGAIQALCTEAQIRPNAGLITPRIIDEDDVDQVSTFRFHSPVSEFVRAAANGFVMRLLPRHVVAIAPPGSIGEVQWVSFACVLVNARMVSEIGPMDEGYFLYFEDTEYCLRARQAGWKVAQALDSKVVHFHGGSGSMVSSEKERRRVPRYYYESRSRYFRQAYGRTGLLRANVMWHLGRGVALSKCLFGRKVPQTPALEYRDIWTNVHKPLEPNFAPKEGP